MNYDVPLPPCVARARWMRRELLAADNRAYAMAGWPLRELDAVAEAHETRWGLWRHATEEAEGDCLTCRDLQPWDAHDVPDIGTHCDDAGERLVARGVWPPEMLLTARQTAAATSRAFLKGRRR